MDWNYISGFFDGEGNVNVILNKNKNAFYLQIRLYSTNKEVLEKIKEFIKVGNIVTRTRNPHHNALSELTITKKQDALFFLNNVKGNCIIKQKVIEYVLSYFNFNHANNQGFDISKIREFNKRGK